VTDVYRRSAVPAAPARCPRDGSELRPQQVESIWLCTCARCHGVWIDAEQMVALVGDGARMDGIALHPVATPETQPRPPGKPSAPIACCRCAKPCERREYGEASHVEVDVCFAHGLWLDGGELRAVVTYARERAKPLVNGGAGDARERALKGMPRRVPMAESAPPAGGSSGVDPFWDELDILESVVRILRRIF
jgi:Zn-finger nucleic acid-binding protein